MKSLRSFLFCLLPALAVASSRADDVRGRVVSTDGAGIPFANVALLAAGDSSFVGGTTSGDSGRFAVSGVGCGPYLLRVSLVGYDTYCQPVADDTAALVVLRPTAVALRGATVTGARPLFTTEHGAIVADVAGSPLQYETTATDVLRKIPGMDYRDDKLQTFDGKTPIIYIDGKKVLDDREVTHLSVRDIKTVKLLLNPGAEYDASAGAVLLITTKRKARGLAAVVEEDALLRHKLGTDQSLDLSYTAGKLSLFGLVEYEDNPRRMRENDKIDHHVGGDLYTDQYKSKIPYTWRGWYYKAGFSLQLGKGHEAGAEYRGYSYSNPRNGRSGSFALLNGAVTDSLATRDAYGAHSYMNRYNLYYKGDLTKHLHMELFGDYVNRNNPESQHVVESSSSGTTRVVDQQARAHFDIYALRSTLRWQAAKGVSLLAGGEWGRTDNRTSRQYNAVLESSDYRNLERRGAGFVEANYDVGRWSFTGGLRFEYVAHRQTNRRDSSLSYTRHYAEWFPSFNIAYTTTAGVRHNLSLRTSMQLPDYDQMTGAANYVNSYIYNSGNSRLKPSREYAVRYMWMWRFLMAQVGYTYTHNGINTIIEGDADNPAMIRTSVKNFSATHELSLLLNAHYKLGFYEPSLTFNLFETRMRQFGLDGKRMPYRATPLLVLDNTLYLPWQFVATVGFNYRGDLRMGGITLQAQHQLSFGLSRDFLGKSLRATLQVNDVTGATSRRQLKYVNGGVALRQQSNYDQRSVELKLTWRFNQSRRQYGGESAAEGELRRTGK